MRIYIIVLHYKNIDDTEDCLSSIINFNLSSAKHSIKLILINNDVQTNLKDLRVKFKIDESEYIGNKKNLGYSAAINLGIKKALEDKKCDSILILNNDIILSPNFLDILTEKDWEIIGPVIKFKSQDDSWVYDYGGKINWWTGRTEHIEKISTPSRSHFVTPGRRPKGLSCKELLPGEFEKIDYVSGCCMLIRKAVFEKTGFFDEDYFFYFEDVDFCVRARKEGFRIKVSDKTIVTHKLSASIGRWTTKAIKYNLRGNFIFIKKNLGVRKISGFIYLALLATKICWDKLWEKLKK